MKRRIAEAVLRGRNWILAALLVIFYLIRVFHEAVFIMVAAGVLYYALTILITVGLWRSRKF